MKLKLSAHFLDILNMVLNLRFMMLLYFAVFMLLKLSAHGHGSLLSLSLSQLILSSK